MAKKLFIGNLPWSATEDELKGLFAQYGEVDSAVIITDKFSGKSKGFGFVEMSNDAEADKAVKDLSGFEMGEDGKKRAIIVNEARPERERPPRNEM